MDFHRHHVALSVADLDAALSFYAIFGFKEVNRYTDPNGKFAIVHLLLDRHMLELFWYAEHQPAPETTAELSTDLPRIGIKHFGLRVDSLEEAMRFVREQGIEPASEISEGKTGVTYFFVKDPSGNFMEISEDNRETLSEQVTA